MLTDDFNVLANRILTFAKSAIAEDGFVMPLGATLTLEGEVVPITRIQPPDERDTAQSLVNELLGTFRSLAQAKRVRAVAWCVDMRVVPPGDNNRCDAIVLFFESSDGNAMVLTTPYRDAPGPGTTFASAYVQTNRTQIFAPDVRP